MTHFGHQALVCAVGLALGIAVGCAGKRGASQNPETCMRDCDQDTCSYKASGAGDNAEYLDCLRACEEQCNPGAAEPEAE
jgi:hypothetical protein